MLKRALFVVFSTCICIFAVKNLTALSKKTETNIFITLKIILYGI